MSGWRRVGPWTLRTAGGAACAVLGAGLAGWLGYLVVFRDWPRVLVLVGLGLLAVWVAYWWRLFLVGVYVTDDRIRVRTLGRTRTFPAATVAEVRSRSRAIPVGGAPIRVRELCFDLNTGRSVGTMLHGDAREGQGLFRRSVLSAPVYDMVADRLHQHVADAVPPPMVDADPVPPVARPRQTADRDDRPEPPPGIIEWRR